MAVVKLQVGTLHGASGKGLVCEHSQLFLLSGRQLSLAARAPGPNSHPPWLERGVKEKHVLAEGSVTGVR